MSDDDVQQLLLDYCDVLTVGNWQQTELSDDGIGVEGARIWYDLSTKGWCSVLSEFQVEAPLEWFELGLRPETFRRWPEVAEGLHEYSRVDITAPGDARLCFRAVIPEDGSKLRRNFLTVGLGPGAEEDWQDARLCIRADVPQQGEYTRILLPATGRQYAIVSTLRKGQNPQSTCLRCFLRDPVSDFSAGFMAIAKMCLVALHRWTGMLCARMPMLLEPARRHYVTLALRSCARGPPLLPVPECTCYSTQVPVGEHFWAPMHTTGFTFKSYLSAFLWELGCPLQVYNSIYGRSLVPYQVIMVRDEWEHVWHLFRAKFSSQRSAYRLLNGGNAAPKVFEDVDPRFVGEPRAQLLLPAYLKVEEMQLLKTEKNTFLEFYEFPPDEPAEIRAKEYP